MRVRASRASASASARGSRDARRVGRVVATRRRRARVDGVGEGRRRGGVRGSVASGRGGENLVHARSRGWSIDRGRSVRAGRVLVVGRLQRRVWGFHPERLDGERGGGVRGGGEGDVTADGDGVGVVGVGEIVRGGSGASVRLARALGGIGHLGGNRRGDHGARQIHVRALGRRSFRGRLDEQGDGHARRGVDLGSTRGISAGGVDLERVHRGARNPRVDEAVSQIVVSMDLFLTRQLGIVKKGASTIRRARVERARVRVASAPRESLPMPLDTTVEDGPTRIRP